MARPREIPARPRWTGLGRYPGMARQKAPNRNNGRRRLAEEGLGVDPRRGTQCIDRHDCEGCGGAEAKPPCQDKQQDRCASGDQGIDHQVEEWRSSVGYWECWGRRISLDPQDARNPVAGNSQERWHESVLRVPKWGIPAGDGWFVPGDGDGSPIHQILSHVVHSAFVGAVEVTACGEQVQAGQHHKDQQMRCIRPPQPRSDRS